MVHVKLFSMTKVPYFHISTFPGIPAVLIMDVFCNSLVSCCLAKLLRYFVNDFYMAAVVPIVIGIAFVFKFHMCNISIVKS